MPFTVTRSDNRRSVSTSHATAIEALKKAVALVEMQGEEPATVIVKDAADGRQYAPTDFDRLVVQRKRAPS